MNKKLLIGGIVTVIGVIIAIVVIKMVYHYIVPSTQVPGDTKKGGTTSLYANGDGTLTDNYGNIYDVNGNFTQNKNGGTIPIDAASANGFNV